MGPHVGVAESRRVPGAVAQGLTKGVASRLALLGDRVVFVPRQIDLVAVLRVGAAGFLEPADPVVHGVVGIPVRDPQVPSFHRRRVQDVLLEAAASLPEFLAISVKSTRFFS